MSDSFVHLSVHTVYSQLKGMVKPKDLMTKCETYGMPAVAMTDLGNLYGAVDFFQSAKKAGIKPILGCEIALAPSSLHLHKEIVGRKSATQLTLLASTTEAWHGLIKLVTKSHLEGFYQVPRCDRETLAEFSKGLICLSGGMNGPLHEWLLKGEIDQAEEECAILRDIFGPENFYIELQDHFEASQQRANQQLLQLARQFQLKPVATNQVYFLNPHDHEAHDALICIGTGMQIENPNRQIYSPELYLKSPQVMREVFKDLPEACDHTLEIAERCEVDLKLDPTASDKYPQFAAPDGSPREEYFHRVCFEGLAERYPQDIVNDLASLQNTTPEAFQQTLNDRLNYEINTISKLGFSSYFLITADFIVWAKNQGIPVGPGRGSAAGSLVAYTMRITDVCPMRYGLLFERFLNEERVSPPDVDIDFCQSRRQEVIQYVREKYGERCVSHIITYGKLGAKSVIRDVARVKGIGYGDADKIAKMIDPMADKSLSDAFKRSEELRAAIESSSDLTELWELATKLEGLQRNTGVHAAGIVIGDRNLDEHVALTRANEGEVVTQLDMNGITEVGLLKMDFLGLKNLTVIQESISHIHQFLPDFDIYNIPIDDKATLDLLNRGETMGVFQLESGGMVETCRKYGIQKIEDIIDLLAVYRPGAMQYIDEMIAVKKGIKKVVYEHPLLETVCGDTYGVMIYQEQVQNAAKLLAGYSLGAADILRRAMGKKKKEEMDKQRATFIEGCANTNQIPAKLADKIFDKIAGFAGYGFNKSHSACYGYISYWTAYLKANFPVEFFCGLLSNEINNTDKIAVFVNECHRLRIEILPPDINESQLRFTPEVTEGGIKSIRYGLAAIKNVGEAAMQALIEERQKNGKFTSLEDLTARLDSRHINKRILENLVKAGALDWLHEPRASLFARLEVALSSATSAHKDKASGQVSLFDTFDFVSATPEPIEKEAIAEWPKPERLDHEKELLGFYVSGHPLDQYRELIDSPKFSKLGHIDELFDSNDARKRFTFAGLIRSVQEKTTKSGKRFAIVILEDFTGSTELLLWSEQTEKAKASGLLEEKKILKIKCSIQIDERTEKAKLNCHELDELSGKLSKQASKNQLQLTLWIARHRQKDLEFIKEQLLAHPGKTPVVLSIQSGSGRRAYLELPATYSVTPCPALFSSLSIFMD